MHENYKSFTYKRGGERESREMQKGREDINLSNKILLQFRTCKSCIYKGDRKSESGEIQRGREAINLSNKILLQFRTC